MGHFDMASSSSLWVVLVLFMVGFAGVESHLAPPPVLSFRVTAAFPDPNLQSLINPSCPNYSGVEWLGGDSSASFPVSWTPLSGEGESDPEYIWLFGDTLLGNCSTPPDRNRSMEYFLHGSIGFLNVSSTSPSHIHEEWSFSKNNTPTAPYAPANATHYYWYIDGSPLTSSGSSIIISAVAVTPSVGGLNFTSLNSMFFIVSDPLESPPSSWPSQTTFVTVPFTGDAEGLGFHCGLTLDLSPEADNLSNPWLYIWGRNASAFSLTTVAMRIRAQDAAQANFDGPDTSLQFWAYHSSSPQAGWVSSSLTAGLSPSNDLFVLAPIEGLPGDPELTVQYHSGLGLWYSFGLDFLSFDIRLYVSSNITGPYVLYPEPVYSIPSPFSSTSSMYCYAIKSHSELVGWNGALEGMVFTYNCNSNDFFHVYEHYPTLYVPQFVRLNLTLTA